MQAHVVRDYAEVAELADALRSGRSGGNPVGVQISPSAPPARVSPVGGAEQGGRWPIWPEESPSCAEQGARRKPGQRWPVTLTVQIGTQHRCCVRATETMTGLCPG